MHIAAQQRTTGVVLGDKLVAIVEEPCRARAATRGLVKTTKWIIAQARGCYAACTYEAVLDVIEIGTRAVAGQVAIGALLGPQRGPYGVLFRTLVQPRLGPVTEREPVPPLQFAQLLGLIFATVGTAGFASGLQLVGAIATAFALGAAFLNAAFGICLGCQIYPLVTRFRRSPVNS